MGQLGHVTAAPCLASVRHSFRALACKHPFGGGTRTFRPFKMLRVINNHLVEREATASFLRHMEK